ncbi:MAG TPA: sprT domain-containing protein [Thiotrichales bacterium]|nr:sprT domain-containing protein [Thiotrichales bacterium]
MTSPTELFYRQLQSAYAFFNQALFNNRLPDCLITMQREKNVMGYFSANRWGNQRGDKTHEIALNPAYFGAYSLIEIFQTIVHEQCHLWQHEAGRPGRRGYHNKEWSEKMESLGLMPSDTGMPGGKKTGEKMAEYPVEGGAFLKACHQLLQSGFLLPWIDRQPAITASCQPRLTQPDMPANLVEIAHTKLEEVFPDLMDTDTVRLAAKTRQKVKYHCAGCNSNAWGKPDLNLICGGCQLPFTAR